MNWLRLSLWTLWCYVSRVSELLFLGISMIPSVERRQRRLSRFFSVPPSFLVSSSHPSHIAQYRAHDRNKSFFINLCPQSSSSSSFKTSYIYIFFLSLLRFHKLDFQLYPMYAVARLPLSTFNVSIFLVSFSSFSLAHICLSSRCRRRAEFQAHPQLVVCRSLVARFT